MTEPNTPHIEYDQQPGSKLRAKWQREGLSHPMTIPLMTLAKRAWREHWPTPSEAGAMIFDVAELSSYLHSLERRIDQLSGGPL